jgi:hypothetical protein
VKLSAVRQWPYINWEPIDQFVEIDVLPEKSLPIDQLHQLINRAQHIAIQFLTLEVSLSDLISPSHNCIVFIHLPPKLLVF